MILMRNTTYWNRDEIVEIYIGDTCVSVMQMRALEALLMLNRDDIPFGEEIDRLEIILNEQD